MKPWISASYLKNLPGKGKFRKEVVKGSNGVVQRRAPFYCQHILEMTLEDIAQYPHEQGAVNLPTNLGPWQQRSSSSSASS